MSAGWFVALAAATFGGAAAAGVWLGAVACRNVEPFADGPRRTVPPAAALVAGAAFVGGALAWRGVEPVTLATFLLAIVALVACFCSDLLAGIVPDRFTLLPLGAIVLGALLRHDAMPALSATVVVVPFAVTAFVSRGRGMGWGDVKLAALGAALLGLQTSLLAFMAAAIAAVAIATLRGRRTEPIAFAPYLATAIAVVMALPIRERGAF